ncbi:hypothetical protein RHSIM_Rhsim04G0183200 [Rhododendron simsii]|uniref:Uncharacterized protein n=1 Tax=Rhododendron simsii TaxID=118357 RepID=A0A834LMY7_RHOSS|nr:hypothetical protein RHSIM_Rhsim04G0183200 [Rhododendron simsii]
MLRLQVFHGREDKLKLRSSQNINVKKPTQFVAVSSKAELSKEAPVIGVASCAEIVGGRRNNNATLCRDNAADPKRDSGRSSTPLIEVNPTLNGWGCVQWSNYFITMIIPSYKISSLLQKGVTRRAR